MSDIRVSPRVVIEACFDENGVAELAYVYDVALAAGLADQPVRLAIRRLEATGHLRQEGRGRKGHLVLTDSTRAREDANVRYIALAYAQDAGDAPWDGRWHLYTFSIPERNRSERDGLRNALLRLGAAPLAPGVYISPHDLAPSLAHETATTTLARYLITAEVVHLGGAGFGDPLATAETLWPAKPLLDAYAPLAEALHAAERLNADPADPAKETATALALAEAFTDALERDPLLPPELRPPDWPPTRLRGEFRDSWAQHRRRNPGLSLFAAYPAD